MPKTIIERVQKYRDGLPHCTPIDQSHRVV